MADLTNINFSQGFQSYLGGNPIGSSSAKSSKGGSGLLSALGPIGAGIDMASGVAGALDSIFGWSAKRQHRMQKELMDKQQDQWKQQQEILNKAQLDQWNRENEYNDPTNYYKRLLEGADNNGLSKQAILEGVPSSVGVSTSKNALGSTSMTGAGGSTLLPFGSSNILGAMHQRAETSLLDAQADYYKSLAGKTSEETELTRLQQSTEVQLAQKYSGDYYAQRMSGYLSQVSADNIQLLQPFQIDALISRSASDFEQSMKTRKETSLLQGRYDADMELAESLILLRGAQRDAEIELKKSREFNNKLWEQTFDLEVQDVINRVSISTTDAAYYEGNIWWQRVGTVLGLGTNAYSAVRGAANSAKRNAIAEQNAINMKNQVSKRMVEKYRLNSRGEMLPYSVETSVTSK